MGNTHSAAGSGRAGSDPRPHAVVIGSGFGGLAAAVRLGARGYRVTVLERLDAPGGRAYVHRQDGYTFDAGPTIVTAPFLLEERWSLAGRRLADDIDLRPLDPFYRVTFADGSHFDCRAREEDAKAEVARLSPGDVAGYERFMRASEAIYKVGFEQLGHVSFDSWRDMARIVPDMLKLGSHRSLHSMVASHVRDPRLRFVLSFHPLFIGGNPFNVTSIYGLISHLERRHGVHFAMGGTGSLVNGLVNLVEGQRGEVRLGAEVAEITVTGRTATGVRLASGERIEADVVVLNPDLPVAYRDLLGHVPWSVKRLRYSPSCFLLLAGSTARYEKTAHHNIHFGRTWDGVFREIIDEGRLMTDPSILVTNPTRSDPSLAPDGREIYYVLFPTPNLDAPLDWRTEGPRYRDEVVRTLEQRGYVGFGDAIEVEHVTTPLDWAERGMERGAPFAAAHTFGQTGPFRPGNLWGHNVVFTGSGTQPGVGVPMVLISGRLAAERVLGVDRAYRSRAAR